MLISKMCSRSTISPIKVVLVIGCLLFLYSCDIAKRPLDFPFDHGPHFNAANEWWYFTGKVQTAEGKSLGFEFTIFKRPRPVANNFAFLGHLAVSDPETSQHIFAEVVTSPPVSGIEEGKPEITVNNFFYKFSETEGIKLKADTETISLDLALSPALSVLPHGEDGIIAMGDGRSSYYYSFTNLATTGTISVNDVQYTISSGRSWMDHQWGNFTVFGMRWNWFSLRFEDGGALMLFQFSTISDRVVRTTWSCQSPDGAATYGEEFSAQANRLYIEKEGHSSYPVDWEIEVPELNAAFQVHPLFDEQSLYDVMTPDYWEGLCAFEGTLGGKPVTGSAYVELTGYESGSLLF
jgi:predicted secreted hydrolase